MRGRTPLLVAALLGAFSARVSAEPVHGRILLQGVYARESAESLSAAIAERRRKDFLGDLRLMWRPRQGRWDFDIAYEAGFDAGDEPMFAAAEASLGVLPTPPPLTWWDLTDRIADKPHLTAVQKIDRLAVGYSSAHLVLRAGRQALTWGAGMVFHPMDLFDPFSPDATDIEYKPGTDMLYGQYLFDDGSDLQFVAVPRPARGHGALAVDASSFALHFRKAIGGLQTNWLAARDHGDWVLALAGGGSIGGAVWNAELIPTFDRGGETQVSALFNVSNASVVGGRDITYFAEYYRNGFGRSEDRYAIVDLPPDLVDRLLRGQTFNTGRDYLAAGMVLQATALLEITQTVIINLNDGSLYTLGQTNYSLANNLNLIAGVQIPIGPVNSEFGGVPIVGASPPFLEHPSRAYVQLRHYF